jgi:hypothetical protein
MRQDKLLELRTLQLCRKRLPLLSFRHSGTPKNAASPDSVASSEIPRPRPIYGRCCVPDSPPQQTVSSVEQPCMTPQIAAGITILRALVAMPTVRLKATWKEHSAMPDANSAAPQSRYRAAVESLRSRLRSGHVQKPLFLGYTWRAEAAGLRRSDAWFRLARFPSRDSSRPQMVRCAGAEVIRGRATSVDGNGVHRSSFLAGSCRCVRRIGCA